jgi:hypothetical protein
MKNPVCIVTFLFLFGWSTVSFAELTPGARYFTGKVKLGISQTTTCYVEVLFTPDLSRITTRSISTLQHVSPAGEPIWVGLGPYTANFLAARSLYRYQDATPGAPVKDLVVNTSGPAAPIKYGVLFWHASAGHHDPIVCDGLTEATSPADLQVIDEAFARFDSLKP